MDDTQTQVLEDALLALEKAHRAVHAAWAASKHTVVVGCTINNATSYGVTVYNDRVPYKPLRVDNTADFKEQQS